MNWIHCFKSFPFLNWDVSLHSLAYHESTASELRRMSMMHEGQEAVLSIFGKWWLGQRTAKKKCDWSVSVVIFQWASLWVAWAPSAYGVGNGCLSDGERDEQMYVRYAALPSDPRDTRWSAGNWDQEMKSGWYGWWWFWSEAPETSSISKCWEIKGYLSLLSWITIDHCYWDNDNKSFPFSFAKCTSWIPSKKEASSMSSPCVF